jgi:hypothetical protein
MVASNAPRWGDPLVSEVQQLNETSIQYPSSVGGLGSRTLSRAGFLNKLRFLLRAKLNVSAYTSGSQKSVYGPIGSTINRLRVTANGSIPLVDLSGLGVTMVNDVANRDGSFLAPVAYEALNNISAAASLVKYDAISATGDKNLQAPFEIPFGLPVTIQQTVMEYGLWLLQNQGIDVTVEANFNPLYAAAASRTSPWSAGTLTATATIADTALDVERELYSIPSQEGSFPDLTWAHTWQELSADILSGQAIFNMPRAGWLLRLIALTLDSNGDPVEYTDLSSAKFVYGANETPIFRKGSFMAQEFLQDYGHYPMKGMSVMDFYKFGGNGFKFAKNTEDLANLRAEFNFASTTAGRVVIVLERLIPVGNR